MGKYDEAYEIGWTGKYKGGKPLFSPSNSYSPLRSSDASCSDDPHAQQAEGLGVRPGGRYSRLSPPAADPRSTVGVEYLRGPPPIIACVLYTL